MILTEEITKTDQKNIEYTQAHRHLNLDLMRCIGILIILIAHAEPPAWLFQLRNFGTPLLIVASALTYSQIYSNIKIHVGEFYNKRLTKLIIPTWIFLTLFFLSIYIFNYSESYKINFPFIFQSFLLFGGKVPYLYILKVYFFLALITPLMFLFKSSFSMKSYYFMIFVAYCFYELLTAFCAYLLNDQTISILNNNVFVFIAYAIIYLYGLRLNEINHKTILIITFISIISFLALASYKYYNAGHFIQTQTSKNPPHIYYLSYAFFGLNVIYLICTRYITHIAPKSAIIWLSSNSLWFYLWHIMGIEIYKSFNYSFSNQLLSSMVMLTFIIVFALCVTLLQKKLVEVFLVNTKHKTLKIIGNYL